MFKRFLSLLLCILSLPAMATQSEADTVNEGFIAFAIDGSLWNHTLASLEKWLKFSRHSKLDEHTLLFPRQPHIRLDDIRVTEMLMNLDEETGKPIRLQISLYNRGDNGKISKKRYTEKIAEIADKLDELTEEKSKPCQVSKKDVGLKVSARLWQTEECAIVMETSSSGKSKEFTAEFIRLVIGPDKESLERGGAQDTIRRAALKENIQRDENGNVWIENVPMVDQGRKGYCVPATVSRVFAYYGMDGVDQHALAALCKSSSLKGTSTTAMKETLDDISHSFHVRLTELDKDGYSEFIADYNAEARKQKMPQYTSGKRGDAMFHFDGDVLLEARGRKISAVRKWMRPIIKSIDAGLPVLWCVQLAFREQGREMGGGGHMRLIIGYNKEEDTIIYSDSWGPGHEQKGISANKACAMTTGRYILRPTR